MNLREAIKQKRLKVTPLEVIDSIFRDTTERIIAEKLMPQLESLIISYRQEFLISVTKSKAELAKLSQSIPLVIAEANKVIKDHIQSRTVEIKGEKGDSIKGDSYILTRKDKKQIASLIDVPIIEKIIEKTESVADKPLGIASKLNTTQESIEMSVIKGMETLQSVITSLQREIRRKDKRGGGGGGMGNVVPESFSISSATTTVTLANKVASNGRAIWANYQGQQQAYGTHFTVSGKTVTLLFTPDDSTFLDIIYIRA